MTDCARNAMDFVFHGRNYANNLTFASPSNIQSFCCATLNDKRRPTRWQWPPTVQNVPCLHHICGCRNNTWQEDSLHSSASSQKPRMSNCFTKTGGSRYNRSGRWERTAHIIRQNLPSSLIRSDSLCFHTDNKCQQENSQRSDYK